MLPDGFGTPIAAEMDLPPVAVPTAESAPGIVRRWSGILGRFLTAQVLTQAATLSAGLLLVNFLPVEEFAVYTVATSVLVTLMFFSDLGISSAVLHFAHRARSRGATSEPYSQAIVALRRWLFLFAAPLALAALVIWTGNTRIDTLGLALLSALVLIAGWFQISATLGLLRYRLDDRYSDSYRAEIAGALARLLATLALIAASWLAAGPALSTAALAACVTAWLVRSPIRRRAGREELASARRELLRYLMPTLPGALYYALQGQVVVWLAATFSGTTNLAQVGALGRLGLLVGIFSNLTPVIFLPRLSRVTDESLFRKRYLQFGACLAVLGGALVVAAAVVPEAFLALLGTNYRGLHAELRIVVASAGTSLLAGYAVAVNNARSWNRWQPLAVTVLALSQIALAAVLSLGTTRGLLLFGFWSAVIGLAMQLVIALLGFLRPEVVEW